MHTRAPLWVVFLGGVLLLPLVAAVGCLALVIGGLDKLARSSHWPVLAIFAVMTFLLALVVIGAANYER